MEHTKSSCGGTYLKRCSVLSFTIMRQPTKSNVKLPQKLLDELGIDGKLLHEPFL